MQKSGRENNETVFFCVQKEFAKKRGKKQGYKLGLCESNKSQCVKT